MHSPVDRPLEVRMAEAQPLFERSVTLLPTAESWVNLAFIAFARGDCDKAADLADKSAEAAGNRIVRTEAETIRDRIRDFAKSGRCAEESERFVSTFAR